jgi:hypothetical protein
LLDSLQIQNLCFFFECPVSHQDYSEANTNDCLDNLGPLSLSRWKFIFKIHVLFPSHVGHIYVAKRADLPHYQEVFSKFVLALKAYKDTMPVYLYMRGEDYSNHFMLVRNSEAAVQPFVERIDWIEIYRVMPSKEQVRERFGDQKRVTRQFWRYWILFRCQSDWRGYF